MNDTSELLDIYSDAVGQALLAYVLGIDVAELPAVTNGQTPLSQAQQSVVETLRQISELPLPYETQEVNRSQVLRAVLMQADDSGLSVARRMHMQAGATEPSIEGRDTMQAPLARLAVDSFPAFLVPRDDEFLPVPIGAGIHVIRILFHHPQQKAFETAVRADTVLGPMFTDGSEAGGPAMMLWRNTGTGGGLQLSMFAGNILNTAWWQIEKDKPTPESFIEASLAQLRLVKRLIGGEAVLSVATFAFTGVLLPEGVERVDLGNASLEATTDADREISPQQLKQNLTGADSTGTTVVVNYDGDVVLRQTFPLKVRSEQSPAADTPLAWPDDMWLPESLDRNAERLRLSLVIAVQREAPVLILPTWRHFADPFAISKMATSWLDPRTAVGIAPVRLTNEELAAWVEWYKILSTPPIDRINVAITRILKGLSERKEPADMLIDAVIAWENLFGTREGETTLRITASLALLLEAEPSKRKARRTGLAKLYKLRSDVVHGNRPLSRDEFPMCREALDIAIQAVRILAKERTDVLDLPDGAARSLQLILGSN